MAAIEDFSRVAHHIPEILDRRRALIEDAFAPNPALVPVGGLRPRGDGWGDKPSIFTFAVREPATGERLLSAAELRPLYEGLARRGILLGQPVSLGVFGGLRVAIGARDLLNESGTSDLLRVFAALGEATALPRRSARILELAG